MNLLHEWFVQLEFTFQVKQARCLGKTSELYDLCGLQKKKSKMNYRNFRRFLLITRKVAKIDLIVERGYSFATEYIFTREMKKIPLGSFACKILRTFRGRKYPKNLVAIVWVYSIDRILFSNRISNRVHVDGKKKDGRERARRPPV